MLLRFAMVALGFLTAGAAPATRPVESVERVMIISIDGLRPDVLLRAQTPNMRRLMRDGSFTLWMQTVDAALTLPSHASMLTGVRPAVHGVDWNADLPPDQQRWPKAPTLFELARAQGLSTAIATGKSKMIAVARPGTVDFSYIASTTQGEDPDVIEQALKLLREHRPVVFVVHLPSVDNVGHSIGWGTPEQISAIEQADEGIGKLLSALNELGLADQTAVIITADHGGSGKTHGPDDPPSRYVPWIISGPGIREGFDLTTDRKRRLRTYDTFATVCWLLGIEPPPDIDGRPVERILVDRELPKPLDGK